MKYQVKACKVIEFKQSGNHVWSDWTVISTHSSERAAVKRAHQAIGKGKLGGYSLARAEQAGAQ